MCLNWRFFADFTVLVVILTKWPFRSSYHDELAKSGKRFRGCVRHKLQRAAVHIWVRASRCSNWIRARKISSEKQKNRRRRYEQSHVRTLMHKLASERYLDIFVLRWFRDISLHTVCFATWIVCNVSTETRGQLKMLIYTWVMAVPGVYGTLISVSLGGGKLRPGPVMPSHYVHLWLWLFFFRFFGLFRGF